MHNMGHAGKVDSTCAHLVSKQHKHETVAMTVSCMGANHVGMLTSLAETHEHIATMLLRLDWHMNCVGVLLSGAIMQVLQVHPCTV